ncbi:patatin-like phospholipase family protein [Paludisphaera soli]|uniref:patatin-like phospholipase family protein n=1 Tax=Paludisphaera soli TaxID=2712865 RepID=UPI0013EA1734|nr:patatin-like phospholipase family protein [Paludisphaera soli]
MPKDWRRVAMRLMAFVFAPLLVLGVPLTQELASSGSATRAFADRYSLAAMSLVLTALTASYLRFIPMLARYLLAHLGQALVLFLTVLMIWGLLGVGLGIPNLIWNESPSTRFLSALGATLLLAMLGVNAYYLEFGVAAAGSNRDLAAMVGFLQRYGCRYGHKSWLNLPLNQVGRRKLGLFLRFARLPFLVLISLPALFPRTFAYVPWGVNAAQDWPLSLPIQGNVRNDWGCYAVGLTAWVLGVLSGVLLVKLLLRLSSIVSGLAGATGAWTSGGFRQYLLVVFASYLFLGLSSAESDPPRYVAGFLLFAASVPALAASRRALSQLKLADGLAALAVALLVCLCGLLTIRNSFAFPAFAIFALLGLLATAQVVYELHDPRPVYYLFGSLLAILIFLFPLQLREGEPITPQEVLMLAALYSVAAFGMIERVAPGAEPWKPWAAAVSSLAAGCALAWRIEAPEAPALALAGLFFLTGCLALQLGVAAAAGPGPLQIPRRVLVTASLLFWILLANYEPFKEQFEGLDYRSFASRDRLSKVISRVYPYDILELASDRDRLGTPTGLLDNRTVLEAWERRLEDCRCEGEGISKPKLVLICVSGGAIRSAYWAATVLDRLGKHPGLENFHDHVRLITGASGGMVAMAYYESAVLGKGPRGAPLDFQLDQDRIPPKSLDRVASFIALQAPWRMLLPRLPGWAADDRGLVLEREWRQIHSLTFSQLRDAESQGKVPSLIFSPMIVDDGRRLLISNLDLKGHQEFAPDPGEAPDELRRRVLDEWPIPVARQNDLDNDNDGTSRNSFSISALELFKLDPKVMPDLTLAAAARMSATFPFVSPAVNLPTNPPLRVVDAGYYDNYGVHLANAWLLQNREWIRRHTSGVLVLQIRDAVSKRDRVGVPSEAKGFFDKLFQGAGLFGSVSDAILRARYSTTTFRNDQESIAVNEVFRRMGAGPSFVATAVFENSAYLSTGSAATGDFDEQARRRWPGLADPSTAAGASDVPMSWYLTTDERRAIDDAIPDPLPNPSEKPQDALGRRAYTLMLRNYAKDRAFFEKALKPRRGDEPKATALTYGLRFADLLNPADERTLPADPDAIDELASRLHGRFADLGAILERFSPTPHEPAAGKQAAMNRGAEDARLAGRVPELFRDPNARKLVSDLFDAPRRPRVDQLGPVVARAIDDELTPIDETTVLMLAHTEWINHQAGFNLSGPGPDDETDAETRKAYYTREFERVMNYHRLEAVRHWWKQDHSVPEPSPPRWPSGD